MGGLWMAGAIASQQRQTSAMSARASRAKQGAHNAMVEIRELKDEVERLCLLNQALWELLRDRTGLTEEMVTAKMQEIDLRDGVADGKISRGATNCPSCGRPVGKRHRRCIYCGQQMEGGDLFQKI